MEIAKNGCVIQYNDEYKRISIQKRRPNYSEWKEIFSDSSKQFGNLTEIEIKDLEIGHCFQFRGLFENINTKEIVNFTTKDSIKIKGTFNQNFIERTKYLFLF